MKKYLTPEMALALKPGATLDLRYDDFNRGRLKYVHYKAWVSEDGVPLTAGHVQMRGLVKATGETYSVQFYEFRGPHRSAPVFAPIMCRGSGAERLYVKTGIETKS